MGVGRRMRANNDDEEDGYLPGKGVNLKKESIRNKKKIKVLTFVSCRVQEDQEEEGRSFEELEKNLKKIIN